MNSQLSDNSGYVSLRYIASQLSKWVNQECREFFAKEIYPKYDSSIKGNGLDHDF